LSFQAPLLLATLAKLLRASGKKLDATGSPRHVPLLHAESAESTPPSASTVGAHGARPSLVPTSNWHAGESSSSM